eukprot:gene7142-6756_t
MATAAEPSDGALLAELRREGLLSGRPASSASRVGTPGAAPPNGAGGRPGSVNQARDVGPVPLGPDASESKQAVQSHQAEPQP